ncbi:hypothetical protein T11_380 [Trichinella zimbabwensis]|uniref:PRA1 family protein n=1 Tax=Trichinella zimbabwensis TaxID=268475 RepID=A0A0V1I0J1_9BILA|nr:hypothetical protein T11_380 [Trichinella zimbabwensis]
MNRGGGGGGESLAIFKRLQTTTEKPSSAWPGLIVSSYLAHDTDGPSFDQPKAQILFQRWKQQLAYAANIIIMLLLLLTAAVFPSITTTTTTFCICCFLFSSAIIPIANA